MLILTSDAALEAEVESAVQGGMTLVRDLEAELVKRGGIRSEGPLYVIVARRSEAVEVLLELARLSAQTVAA